MILILWFVSCWCAHNPGKTLGRPCHMEPEEDECGDAGYKHVREVRKLSSSNLGEDPKQMMNSIPLVFSAQYHNPFTCASFTWRHFCLSDNIGFCLIAETRFNSSKTEVYPGSLLNSPALPRFKSANPPRIGVLWWKSLKIALRNSTNFSMFPWLQQNEDDPIFTWMIREMIGGRDLISNNLGLSSSSFAIMGLFLWKI